MSSSNMLIRKPKPCDISTLHQLAVTSTGSAIGLTIEDLHDSIFGIDSNKMKENLGVRYQDDLEGNLPFCQAYLAEVNKEVVGFIIFHYFYSPWLGHCVYMDDLFVKQAHPRKDISSSLISHVEKHCKDEKIERLLFNSAKLRRDMVERDGGHEMLVPIRYDGVDWSVYRMSI